MVWPNWSRRDPQGLARFVTPQARDWLTLGLSRFDLEADPQGRLRVVHAIYDALARERIHYAIEEYNPSAALQPIREPAEILRRPKEGTCLDLAVLFSGLCMGNRLLPIIVVLKGHAIALVSLSHDLADWDGYRPEREWFDQGPIDEPERFSAAVGLVDSGAYVAVECTGFASSEKLAQLAREELPETVGRIDGVLPFERAVAAGREQLSLPDRALQFAVDVAVAHYGWRIEPFMQTAEAPPEAPTPREAPAPPSVFVGREGEAGKARAALLDQTEEAVTVLHGMAGVGKSALAQHVVADPGVEQHFADGTFWFDLRAIDVMTALEHIALAFGQTLAQHTLVDSRAAFVRSILRGKRVVIVVDGADDAPSVLSLCPGSPSAVLVTTIDRDLAYRLTREPTPVYPLAEASAIRVLEALVDKQLSSGDRRSLRRIVTLLGGLPLALELAARLVNRQLATKWGSLDDVVDALERDGATLQLGLRDRQVRATFESTYRRALDQSRQELFARLGVFRPGILDVEEIAAAWGVTAEVAGPLLDDLTSLSLVGQEGRTTFRLQPLLRDYALELFRQRGETERIEIHRRVAGYYKHWVHSYEEAQQQQTLCWYRFERPDWQDKKSRLLFHLSRLPERDRVRLSFARLYLDAFWWWGSYVRFEYCEQLVEDWAATYDHPDDRTWFEALAGFARSYPLGLEKRRGGGWSAVERVLLELRTLAGIDGELSGVAPGEPRRLRAITGLFLGQARRYLADVERAHAHYQEAEALLEEGGEWWDLAWALFDHADLDVELRHPNDAVDRWHRAVRITVDREIHDVELRSNLYRIEADVAWLRGEVDRAFSDHALATFYGYRFQASPHPPDVYTLTFYREMVTRTMSRIADLVTTGKTAEAEQAVALLSDFWAPYWSSVGRTPPVITAERLTADGLPALAADLFPPMPSERKLTSRSVKYAREFVDEVRKHTDDMARTLDRQAWAGPPV